jgi:hypothetical protein
VVTWSGTSGSIEESTERAVVTTGDELRVRVQRRDRECDGEVPVKCSKTLQRLLCERSGALCTKS